MAGFPFKYQGAGLIHDAAGKIEPYPRGDGGPKFDIEHIVIACRGFIAEMAFDDRENNILFLPLPEGRVELTKEFAARGFEEFEVPGVVNVITHGAISVSHAVNMSEDLCVHGRIIPAGGIVSRRETGK